MYRIWNAVEKGYSISEAHYDEKTSELIVDSYFEYDTIAEAEHFLYKDIDKYVVKAINNGFTREAAIKWTADYLSRYEVVEYKAVEEKIVKKEKKERKKRAPNKKKA